MRISVRCSCAESSSGGYDPRTLHLPGVDHVSDRYSEPGDLSYCSKTVLKALVRLLHSHYLFLKKWLSHPVRIVIVEISAEVKM